MKISVIVVSYNVRPLLRRCLESIPSTAEVIVVDNASQDGSAGEAQSIDTVRCVALAENRGFSCAVNIGAREASGEIFLLLNPDAQLAPGSLPRMESALLARRDAAVVGFRQQDTAGHFQLALGPPPHLHWELLRHIVQKRLDAGDQRLARWLDGLLWRPRTVPWVSGSSLMVHRRDFESVGGFDERYFLYFEDIDFCLRIGAIGRKVVYDPRVTVLHERGASSSVDAPAARKHYRRSQLLFWERHRGARVRNLMQWYQLWRGESVD